MMNHQIGEVAGKIYRTLEKYGPLSVRKIKTQVGMSDFLISSGIGWLAREDKIKFDKKGNSLLISLRIN